MMQSHDPRRMYDHMPLLEALWNAWNDPGRKPQYHERMRDNVRHDMPILAHVLDRIQPPTKRRR